jgi:hypothetical protein
MDEVVKLIKEKLTSDMLLEYCLRCGYSISDWTLLENVLASTDQEPFSAEEISNKIIQDICVNMIPIMDELKASYQKEKLLA